MAISPYVSGLPAIGRATSAERVACNMLRMGTAGMLVGAMVAGAGNARKVRNGEMHRDEAIRQTALSGAKTGVAAGVGTGLASLIGSAPVLPLATMVLAGAAVMYGLDSKLSGAAKSGPPTPEK